MPSTSISIREVGPREGFQMEPPGIPTSAKAALVDALSATGLSTIQVASFASRRAVPQAADAEQLTGLITPRENVSYTAVWFNVAGFERALSCPVLALEPIVAVSGSAAFAERNWRSDSREMAALNEPLLERYAERRLPVTINVAAAFGCNFEGRVPAAVVLRTLAAIAAQVRAHGLEIGEICLADTMGWASPASVRAMVRAARAEYPSIPLSLHLHDTRGLGIANAMAGLDEGVERFDSSIAGLGGCPFSGESSAAGNIATEDFALLCHELGFATGIEPGPLLEAAALAETVVGHPGSGRTLGGGHLTDTGVLRVRRAGARSPATI